MDIDYIITMKKNNLDYSDNEKNTEKCVKKSIKTKIMIKFSCNEV
ncbi:protein of unknown function [Tepidibacter aestuarii]|nr:protein of unknown function [Tepidibacter aestuarii]